MSTAHALPTPEQVQAALVKLGPRAMPDLSKLSGVPEATLNKIRRGETTDPGLKVLSRFWPHVGKLRPQGF